MTVFIDFLMRVGCAFLTGMLIGLERQYRQCNAGLRTNVLVAVGAAAFTVLSYVMSATSGDPSRIAAQIVTGVGFLGGGLILKDGFSVRGLNTAATIWCSAACGTLSGFAMYGEAMLLVAFVLFTHCVFRPLCTYIDKITAKIYKYSVRINCLDNETENIMRIITGTLAFDKDIRLESLFYKGIDDKKTVFCDFETVGERKAILDLLVSRVRSQSGVLSVGFNKNTVPRIDF